MLSHSLLADAGWTQPLPSTSGQKLHFSSQEKLERWRGFGTLISFFGLVIDEHVLFLPARKTPPRKQRCCFFGNPLHRRFPTSWQGREEARRKREREGAGAAGTAPVLTCWL